MCVVPLCVVYNVCVCVGGWCKGMDVDVWVFLGCLYVYVCVHFISVCLCVCVCVCVCVCAHVLQMISRECV